MNNKLSITYLILLIAPLFFGCRGAVTAENKSDTLASPVSVGQGYTIDTKESVVIWKGAMLIGANFHTGYVHISSGELLIENSRLVGGTATIDMNTMGEKNDGSDNDLIKHLKSPDFFDVKKFPLSTIAITDAAPAGGAHIKVTGKLTIKGITHPITFPVKIEVKDGIVEADGRLVIDRTKWDVRYNSGKFYDNLADETISDSVEFNIKIIAKK
ncbi:YceI family protein [Chitinophaga pendula]|uniref:YceI family protein n=1 Tax=Chitinophaga TaxID=79328 RepID=UPI000BAEF0C5|nr:MULTISPECIES: YceI family protein [Chitinophaga]ASZ11879.1 lipid-binding protein [Chitinophaga sp. MD30]UCJ05096.1 YceI family protein [Chitinophaga pendula]